MVRISSVGLFFIEKYYMDAGTANYLVFVSEVR
jgi:hypothetical protein